MLYRMSLLLLLTLLFTPAFAQQAASPAMMAFAAKDYATYLANVQTELAPSAQKPAGEFAMIAVAAIALDKTANWDGASGKQVRELLAASPAALRYLDATRQLLGGDLNGLSRLFEGGAPDPRALSAARKLLAEHGYDLAGNAVSVVAGVEMPGKRVIAWAAIPKDKRGPLDALMDKRLDPANRRMLAELSFNLYLKTPKEVMVPPAELFALALQLEKGTNGVPFASIGNAERLAQNGKQADGIAMVNGLATANPTDAETQGRAALFLWSNQLLPEAAALYAKAITTVPAPATRSIRLQYLGFLDWLPQAKKTVPGIDDRQQLTGASDLLLAGDACLVGKQFADATVKYQAELTKKGATLERRLDAWNGLLDSDPATALAAAPALLREIGDRDAETRTRLARWYGNQLWRALMRDLPMEPPVMAFGAPPPPYRPLKEVANWQRTVASLLEGTVALDPVGCLRARSSDPNVSLRLPLATAYTVARQPDKAAEILSRRITYQIPPPPGGWTHYDGTPEQFPDKPHEGVTPGEGETQEQTEAIFYLMVLYPDTRDDMAQLAGLMARHVGAELKAGTLDDGELNNRFAFLTKLCMWEASGQDPMPLYDRAPRPPRAPNLPAYALFDAALREVLALDAYTKKSSVLLREGLAVAMTIVRDPKLLEGYFSLMTLELDRLRAANVIADLPSAVRVNIIGVLASAKRADLQPYIQQLQEKYVTPR